MSSAPNRVNGDPKRLSHPRGWKRPARLNLPLLLVSTAMPINSGLRSDFLISGSAAMIVAFAPLNGPSRSFPS